MKKYKVGIIIAVLFILGVFSIAISTENFFFSTKYYQTPIAAYHANGTYNVVYGDANVKEEIGLLLLDDKTCLFIGEIDENCFVIDEMAIKNDKYASKGNTIFYDLREPSDGTNKNRTNIINGFVEWAVMYHQSEIEKLVDTASVETYLINGKHIYLVVYHN